MNEESHTRIVQPLNLPNLPKEGEKIRQVVDDLIDRQFMVHEILKERSAKGLPTTYKEVAPLLEDIKAPERQARKTLEQLLKLNLISGDLEVRNKVEAKWYWIKKLVQES